MSQNITSPPGGFAGRPTSTAWEKLPLADSPKQFLWVWFKPPNLPYGLALQVPSETFQTYPHRERLTFRTLVQCVGISAADVSYWFSHGAQYDSMQGTSPYWDQLVPEPTAAADPNILVCLNMPQPDVLAPAPPSSAIPWDNLADLYQWIENDWKTSLHIEHEAAALRSQLAEKMSRLSSLNRDLSSEERMHSAREDRDDWQEARRWMRDAAGRLSRFIKEHDIGDTSTGGNRSWLEAMYRDFVATRQPIADIQRVQWMFESHRKMLQVLQNDMVTALAAATQDAERRAQTILARIHAKVQVARAKRPKV